VQNLLSSAIFSTWLSTEISSNAQGIHNIKRVYYCLAIVTVVRERYETSVRPIHARKDDCSRDSEHRSLHRRSLLCGVLGDQTPGREVSNARFLWWLRHYVGKSFGCSTFTFPKRRSDLLFRRSISKGTLIMNNDDLLIRAPEQEFKRLLDREHAVSDVRQHLSRWIALMQDLVNYGTNLIPRCFTSSARTLGDVILIGTLLRQAVAMLDGAEVLLSNGAVHSAKLQMRALLETALYIDWVLLGDADRKTDYYYVHNLRRKRRWAERIRGVSPAGREFVEMMDAIGVPTPQDRKNLAEGQIAEIDRVLAKPRFALINADFEDHRKGTGDTHWYSPLGPKNLREVAKSVGKLPQYVLWYSTSSEVIHGSNYGDHVKFKPESGRITFEPIRYLENFGSVYHFSVIITIPVYRSLLEKYRPGELPAFSRKYLESWQKDFMNVPTVNINSEIITV